MKKFFTLLMLLTVVFSMNAQQSLTKSAISKNSMLNSPKKDPTFLNRKQVQPSANRNIQTAFAIDYVSVDALYAQAIGTDFYYDNEFLQNNRYKNSDFFTLTTAAINFDSLEYIDATSQLPTFVPRAGTTLTLDSLDFIFQHTNASGTNDTLHLTVYDRDSFKVSSFTLTTGKMTNNIVWDTFIVVNQTIPTNFGDDGAGGFLFTDLTVYPNKTFATGKTFGFRFEFSGDTSDHFMPICNFRDDCGNACVAAPTAADNPLNLPSSLYYLNLVTQGGTNLSGINRVGYDCNTDGIAGTPGFCEEFVIQNWRVLPFVTADVALGASIIADSLKGCPGTILNLTAFGFGADFTNGTYSWATTSGSLSAPSDQTTALTIVGNAVVTVTVTDGGSNSATASVNIVSNGITVTITDSDPITLTCGGSSTIHTTVAGVTTGKTYAWSNSSLTTASLAVSTSGHYVVTVTNNKGCSATAGINVNYNGVSNNVNFNTPSGGANCQGSPVCFTNLSTNQTGWNQTWDFTGQGGLGFTNCYTYTSPGVYNVTLTMDSAGCTFISPSHSVTVTATQTVNPGAPCYTGVGINEIDFSNGVSIVPNPTHGNVAITVNGVDKNISIKVYNVIGSEVKSFAASDVTSVFTKTFDLSDLANGTYLVKIQSAENIAIKRLTVSK